MSVAEILETMAYGPAPEAAAPAQAWLAQHDGRFDMFIDNRWVPPRDGVYFDSVNPGNGKQLASIAQAGPTDVDAAVQAAAAAQPAWAALPGHARARYLYALARQVQKQSRLLAVLETLDNGKPIRETRDLDIPLVARHFAYHAGWAQLMSRELPGYEAVGVVGQIIPWNFPLLMLAWKIAPALAMGNTVVLKPAEFTSLTALAFAELVRQAGLPPGVVNIITGDGRAGELLVAHPGVQKIAFTGSTEVGRQIRKSTAGTGKRLSLELGGKSPFLVFDDADLDSAVEGVVDAIWFNQGQVCCAGSRLLVQENVADEFLARIRTRMERLRVGDPLDKAIDIGAIVAPVQLARIRALVAQGVEEGATLWQPSWACPTEGLFYPPTLFTNVAPAATIAQVEIFGPVLVSMTFRSPSEAVMLANNTPYGLAASVWSENINLALDVAPKIKAGTVWINSTNLFDAASGFGGYRESGYGREGGKEGLYEYVKRSSPRTRKSSTARAVHLREQADEATAIATSAPNGLPPLDRTAKLFIGGKQARPDSGYSLLITDPAGRALGEVGEGNRKDIRNAVEAAHAAGGWAGTTGYNRAQILYYLAENLSARAYEFAQRIAALTGSDLGDEEVSLATERLFTYGAWADKYDGRVARTPLRGLTIAMPEPLGVIGILCPDEAPLLGFISLLAPAIAMGNTVVIVPSESHPLAATDFYQVLETSDVPAGVVNIVTGNRDGLAAVLAAHDDVASIWYFGPSAGAAAVEEASIGNLKRTWSAGERPFNWFDREEGEGEEFLREATQVKNIWAPYGE
ncbi:MAG TPA: aldehyde dehydrogenase family protein [Chloroflexota bacterium]|nr:aldehyde dehydrogenase family protein [Chloroflexota bacterium]